MNILIIQTCFKQDKYIQVHNTNDIYSFIQNKLTYIVLRDGANAVTYPRGQIHTIEQIYFSNSVVICSSLILLLAIFV